MRTGHRPVKAGVGGAFREGFPWGGSPREHKLDKLDRKQRRAKNRARRVLRLKVRRRREHGRSDA